jgi:DNA-binding protein HU-beta
MMNRAQLIKTVAADSGLSKVDAARAIETVLEAMNDAVERGSDASASFGKFSITRASRPRAKRSAGKTAEGRASRSSSGAQSKQAAFARHVPRSRSRKRSGATAGQVFENELRSLLGDVSPDLEVARRAARLAMSEQAWEQGLEAVWDTRDVCAALDVTKQRVSVLVHKHRLIALPQNGRLRFPVWQFTALDANDRAYLAQAHHLLVSEGEIDPWSAASWFMAGHPDLENQTPAEWLRDGGEHDRVLTAAHRDATRARQ